MNFFKEYDDSQKNMSRWLPWACLVSEGVVANKDGSFLGVFSYEKKEQQEEGRALQVILRNLGTGWSWWSERKNTAAGDKNYIVLCWNPRKTKGHILNLPGAQSLQIEPMCLEVAFQSILNACPIICDGLAKLRQLKSIELMQYLHDTVTPSGSAIMLPKLYLYLDALLSQQNSYRVDCQNVKINKHHIQAIQIFGFITEDNLRALFAFLKERNCEFRFVRRLLCFDDISARKEVKRYMKGWFAGRKSIMPALNYEYNPEKLCGILTNTLLVWHEDAEKLEQICGEIQATLDSAGELSVIEKYRISDVWMGTLPGMFRSNLTTPLVELDDAAALVV